MDEFEYDFLTFDERDEVDAEDLRRAHRVAGYSDRPGTRRRLLSVDDLASVA